MLRTDLHNRERLLCCCPTLEGEIMQARLIPFLLVSVLVASSSIAADIPPAMALLRSSYESNLQATVRYDAAADGMATYSKKLDSMAETLARGRGPRLANRQIGNTEAQLP